MLRIKSTIYLTGQANHNDQNTNSKQKMSRWNYWLFSFGHWDFEFWIYLEFGACHLEFYCL